jgi:hypothetical protein
MAAVTASRAAGATRLVALGGIRIAGLAVAVGAAAVGVAFASLSIVGPDVWVFSGDGTGAGRFLDLPLAPRIARAVAFLLPCLTIAVMALLLADLAWRVRREVRFGPAISRTAAALAITLGVGSWLSKIAANLVAYSAFFYPDDIDPSRADLSTLEFRWALGATTFLPDPALLGLAVVLGVLAYIIRAGERLQRDTEGLV